MASWKEPWPCRAVQQPGAYTTGNNQGRVFPALSIDKTLLRGSIAQPSVLLELVPTLDGCSAPRTPDLTSGALLSWGRGSPDPPTPPDTLAAGSRQAVGPARSSVGPGGCNLVTSPPLWAGSGVLPLQVKQGVCKSPLLGVQEPEVLGQGFPGAALLLSLSALLASVLDVDASAAPARSPPQTFPVARSKSEWRGPGMETKRTLQPSSESTPSFPCPGDPGALI